MIPNTTQIPNNLFNGEMQKMKDTELRVVLLVARKTLGWIEDTETGMRKEEDWISHTQIMQFTGRASQAISAAIDNCIKQGWIEARDERGQVLDTPEKRSGQKIYYRLGKIFLSRVPTSLKNKEASLKNNKDAALKIKDYKRNSYTKYTPKNKNKAKEEKFQRALEETDDIDRQKVKEAVGKVRKNLKAKGFNV